MESVISAKVDLHVGPLWHVGFDTVIARVALRMETMLGRFDDWSVHVAAFVAAHTKSVVCDW